MARLAGFPEEVVRRARVLLEELERGSTRQVERLEAEVVERQVEPGLTLPGSPAAQAAFPPPSRTRAKARPADTTQLTLFRAGPDPVTEELEKLDPMNMTPLQALQELVRLKGLVKR